MFRGRIFTDPTFVVGPIFQQFNLLPIFDSASDLEIVHKSSHPLRARRNQEEIRTSGQTSARWISVDRCVWAWNWWSWKYFISARAWENWIRNNAEKRIKNRCKRGEPMRLAPFACSFHIGCCPTFRRLFDRLKQYLQLLQIFFSCLWKHLILFPDDRRSGLYLRLYWPKT